MTDDIAAIKERWANATPGPWQVAFHGVYEVEAPPNQLVADVGICGRAKEDAEAIAAAPQDIATLLAALEARDAELARLREDAAGLGAAIDVSLPPLTWTPAAEVDRLRAELEAARREAGDAREERDHWHAKVAHIGQALGMAAPESVDWRDVSADAVARRAEAAREGLRMLRGALSEATDDLGDFARRTQDRADAAAAMRAYDALARYDAIYLSWNETLRRLRATLEARGYDPDTLTISVRRKRPTASEEPSAAEPPAASDARSPSADDA